MTIKKAMSYLILSICLINNMLYASANTSNSTKTKMLADIDFITNTFDSVYAPADWKKQIINWDLQIEAEKARNKIQSSESINLKEYQLIVKDLLKSTQDYHVNVGFFRSKSATLPFTIKSAENRYFIVDIDKNHPNSRQIKFKVGDEILEFDGKPIKNAISDISKIISDSNNATDDALAELLLTQRHASMLVNVPEGSVKVKVLAEDSTKPNDYTLNWHKTDEIFTDNYKTILNKKFDAHLEKTDLTKFGGINIQKIKADLFNKFNLLKGRMIAHNGITDINLNKFSIGNQSSFIPELGKVIWRSENGVYAYIYKNNEGKNIGFLRIPDYLSIDKDELKDVLKVFNNKTDALIIDQNNNPGGSVIILYEILSLLTDKPLTLPEHEFTLIQEDVAEAYWLLDYIDELEIMVNSINGADENEDLNIAGLSIKQFIKAVRNYCNFIIKEWSAGKNYTRPYPLFGIKEIKPSKIAYKKPITILINSLDFSCGDFMPAVIQDNNIDRIKIVGTKTAGAGGLVRGTMYPNSFGIHHFSYTASIATRKNNIKIENNGVTPDILLELTINDLQNNFVDYGKSINEHVARSLIKK